MAKILLLDDDKQIRRAIELQLKKHNHTVVSGEDGQKGLEILAAGEFDLIITDLQMPGITGIELLHKLKEKKQTIPTIVLTGYGSVESAVEAMKLGAVDFITKPPQLEEITLKVEKLISRQALVEENQRLKKELENKFQFEGIIGKSPVMVNMFERLKPLAGDRHISILLVGETGTGKELTAKAIHYYSPRKNEPFVAINCGALPEHLLESELFGYEKGAFTDAKKQKKGLFEMAQGGTLFLDEISSMPLEMQVKLLRAIEENEIRRVGGTKTIPLDIRFIAASNQDLEKLIAENKFRNDLFYRLAVATVILPPLRERNGDIRLLTYFFKEKFNREKEKSVEIDPEVINVLEQYDWPGNVRELENLIELQVVTAIDGKITNSNLPEKITKNTITQPFQFGSNNQANDLKTATRNIVEGFEKEFLFRKLKENNWNISKTAVTVGISRGALHAKIKQYDLKTN